MRLIDADALVEVMKKTEAEYENAMACPSWWSAFNVINEQPTAYDVDAVVAEIQKESIPIFDEDSETNVKVIGTKEVTEIVRKGGVNE